MTSFVAPLVYKPARASLSATETGSEPVSVAEAKDHANYTDTDKDTLWGTYVTAARQMVERMTNRAIIEQTRVYKMNAFPTGDMQVIELPGGNVQSVTSVQYVDGNGDTQTFTGFDADLGSIGGTARISLAANQEWPEVRDEGLPVTITYVAGYDASASPAITPPASLTVAIRLIAAAMFENREAHVEQGLEDNPMLKALVAPYKVPWVA